MRLLLCQEGIVTLEMIANKTMHRTATPRWGLESAGLFGGLICSQSPFPVAVGDLSRLAR